MHLRVFILVEQHPGTVRDHHVRRDIPNHIQECTQLAPRSDEGLRAHPYRVVRKQGAFNAGRHVPLF